MNAVNWSSTYDRVYGMNNPPFIQMWSGYIIEHGQLNTVNMKLSIMLSLHLSNVWWSLMQVSIDEFDSVSYKDATS